MKNYNEDVASEFEDMYDVEPLQVDIEKSLRALKYWREQADGVSGRAKMERGCVDVWESTQLESIKKKIEWHESVACAYIDSKGTKTENCINGTIKKRSGS